jgi:hypothetical protein
MTTTVILIEAVGGPYAVSSADGGTVHDRIAESLWKNEPVVLSFAGVGDVTSAFLNTAIGKLGEFDDALIRDLLRVVDADGDQLALLKRVVDRAKDFFRSPVTDNAALTGALGE